jgi:hypothetical protein
MSNLLMTNKLLKRLMKDNEMYGAFLRESLSIEEKFKLRNYNTDSIIFGSAMAYTLGHGEIAIEKSMKELLYFVCVLDELKSLKEGARFLIYHELGHFHDKEHKNENVSRYFHKLGDILNDKENPTGAFPESEATRYGLLNCKNSIKPLSGFFALASFVSKTSIDEAIETLEKHFSLYSLLNNDNIKENYFEISKISSFKLSEKNKKIIKDSAKYQLALLNKNLRISNILKKVTEKNEMY